MVMFSTLRPVLCTMLLVCAACSPLPLNHADANRRDSEEIDAGGSPVSGFGLQVMVSGYIPLARNPLPSPQRFKQLAEKNFRASPFDADGWFEEAPELLKSCSVNHYDGGGLRLYPDGAVVQVDWETVIPPDPQEKPYTVLPKESWFFERQCSKLEIFEEGFVRATMADGFVFEGYIVLCILKYDPTAFTNIVELDFGRSGPSGGWPAEIGTNWPTLHVTEWKQFPDGRLDIKPAPLRPLK